MEGVDRMIKNFQKHKKIFILIFVAVLGIGITSYYFMGKFQESSHNIEEAAEEIDLSESNHQASVTIENDFTSIEDLISNYHDYYNNTLGWGKYKAVEKNVQLENANQLLEELNQLEYENKVEKKDITHISQLAEIYIQTEEANALLYLHRIFHDLDKAVNDYKHKDTFGATATYGKKGFFGNQLDDIEDYIEDKQK